MVPLKRLNDYDESDPTIPPEVLTALSEAGVAALRLAEAAWAARIAATVEEPVTIEHRLYDKSRVDLVMLGMAMAIEWVPQWTSAIGRSVWYSVCSNLPPAICLLCTNQDEREVLKATAVASKLDIAAFFVDVETEELAANAERIRLVPWGEIGDVKRFLGGTQEQLTTPSQPDVFRLLPREQD